MLGRFNLSYFYLIINGFQLGGNIKQSYLRNSSAAYAKKNSNFIVKLPLTSLQLKKSINLMARYIKKKTTLYFVHSHFGFKLLMKQLFDKANMFYLKFKRNLIHKLKKKKYNFKGSLLKQLKKLYLVNRWNPGFLTNRSSFFITRLNKKLKIRYPKFGFLNDYKVNLISIKEFKYTKVPFSSMINLNVSNTNHGFFDIPGNGVSYDTYFLTLI